MTEQLKGIETISIGTCYCGYKGILYTVYSMTMYLDKDGKYDDEANRVPPLCHHCSGTYQDNWQERWDDYYSGCL